MLDKSNAWHKLEVLVRFRMADRIDEIERLGELAGADVSWEWAYDQEVEGETISYGVVTSVCLC